MELKKMRDMTEVEYRTVQDEKRTVQPEIPARDRSARESCSDERTQEEHRKSKDYHQRKRTR